MKQKYRFNMVEIALAIVIIAIGLSSVLVLFPIGINATRAAIEESLAPEVSEYVVHFIRSRFLNTWVKTPDAAEDSDFAGLFSVDFSEIKEVDSEEVETLKNSVSTTAPDPFPNLKKGTKDGLYKFSKTNADGETFTAFVKIWKPQGGDLLNSGDSLCPLYIRDVYKLEDNKSKPPQVAADCIRYDNGEGKPFEERPKLTDGNLFSKFAQSVLVEISWPVESPEDERNKRTFRVDVYNPYHKIQIAP